MNLTIKLIEVNNEEKEKNFSLTENFVSNFLFLKKDNFNKIYSLYFKKPREDIEEIIKITDFLSNFFINNENNEEDNGDNILKIVLLANEDIFFTDLIRDFFVTEKEEYYNIDLYILDETKEEEVNMTINIFNEQEEKICDFKILSDFRASQDFLKNKFVEILNTTNDFVNSEIEEYNYNFYLTILKILESTPGIKRNKIEIIDSNDRTFFSSYIRNVGYTNKINSQGDFVAALSIHCDDSGE